MFHNLPGFTNAQWMSFLKRFSRFFAPDVSCSELERLHQWHGRATVTGGPQETFRQLLTQYLSVACSSSFLSGIRACSDTKIRPSRKRKPSPSKVSNIILDLILCCLWITLSYSRLPPSLTTQLLSMDLTQFEDYYDELLVERSDNINTIDGGL